ncbi:tyrosine--tRNA ligase [Fretibacterium sp. OH1220_COT-178]|uniref:tyrosine--tRNA ligase n=1 Tax=Fretibacterium sp. OH1220_COT-178 TaxID=2491047 RepID=UPI000F601DED|nr:tyrosine--tRNA ligase [Fretibacterium sp. OH1220_COT-178]RRD65669.1 tyrosine--tRNA ligase [Fretibacterium sp. OH1220_COT-178]
MSEKAFDVLRARGYVEWCSAEDRLREVMDEGMVTAYVGFDPTADSLHVGHLIPLMALAWLQRAGHRPIALAGGGTGLIGDPSGKSKERNLITVEEVRHNVESVRAQLAHFLDFDCGKNSALLLNNYDWLSSFSFLDVLRDVGKYFSVNNLIAREYVRSRLEDPEKGISYTEFSYVLLQSIDFRHLYESYGCRLQMGGNDQQGNLLAGSDYVRKSLGGEVFGLTQPLLLTTSGTKFGKTEAGAVWLDPRRTTPYRFYQFWVNTDDRDVERLLKLFTFLPLEEIRSVIEEHSARPEERKAQRRLALETTRLVHGEEAARGVVKASSVLFDSDVDLSDLTEEAYATLREEVPFSSLELSLPAGALDVLTACGACESRGEAKRAIRQGGVSLNGVRIVDEGAMITRENLGAGRYLFVRIGRKRFHLAAFS